MSNEQDKTIPPDNNLPLIAVVDDDPLMRKTLIAFFEKRARVVTGVNTHDALRLLREENLSLMTLDDIMPGGMTGLSFLESIKDDPVLSKTPIIMITASNKPEEVTRGLAAGAVDYLDKPVNPQLLEKAVQAIWNRRSSRITLMLRDKALVEELCERLSQLACDVCVADEKHKTMFSSNAPDLYVLDHDALPFLNTFAQGEGAWFPACLCLVEPEAVAALQGAGKVTAIGEGHALTEIIRQIGILLTTLKCQKNESNLKNRIC